MNQIIETDENGALTIPAELLSERTAHARYVVERNGSDLHVAPVSKQVAANPGHEERMKLWKEHAERVAHASPGVKSVIEVLSEMRR